MRHRCGARQDVIPACRESFSKIKKDSGQAGMTKFQTHKSDPGPRIDASLKKNIEKRLKNLTSYKNVVSFFINVISAERVRERRWNNTAIFRKPDRGPDHQCWRVRRTNQLTF